jgi:hypothetical protein
MPAVAIIFVLLSLLQWAAVFAAFSDWMGLHWIFASLLSFAVAFTPLLGTGLAIVGAISAWGMSGIGATALFLGPAFVMMLVARSSNR